MKTLILTSSGFIRPIIREEILRALPEKPSHYQVAYISTASKVIADDSNAQNEVFIMNCLGFHVVEIDLAQIEPHQLKSQLAKKQIVYVQGGNGFYLLKHARRTGFLKLGKQLVEQGKLIYIGKSGGSYLACPSLEMHTWSSKPWNRYGVTDLTAMNLVPFLIKAHYSEDQHPEIKSGSHKSPYPVRLLTNDQALLVQDQTVKLIGKGEQINL